MTIRNNTQLIKHISNNEDVKFVFFWGHKKPHSGITKSCFSQWYDSPFHENGHHFLTAEHYMMFKKARLFGDNDSASQVLAARTPGEVKAIGRKVKGFNEHIWLENRFDIVVRANLAKFSGNPELKEFLLSTRNRVLVEASPVDKIWGIGLAKDHPSIENPHIWKGLNLLGYALMEVRDQLKII